MKIKICSLVCLLCLIVGCSGSASTDKVCTVVEGDDQEIEITATITSEDEKVHKISTKTTVDMSKTEDFTVEGLEETAQSIQSMFDKVEGMTYVYKEDNNKFIEEVTIEITDGNFESLKEQGMIVNYLDENGDLMKRKDLVKRFEDSGMTCK